MCNSSKLQHFPHFSVGCVHHHVRLFCFCRHPLYHLVLRSQLITHVEREAFQLADCARYLVQIIISALHCSVHLLVSVVRREPDWLTSAQIFPFTFPSFACTRLSFLPAEQLFQAAAKPPLLFLFSFFAFSFSFSFRLRHRRLLFRHCCPRRKWVSSRCCNRLLSLFFPLPLPLLFLLELQPVRRHPTLRPLYLLLLLLFSAESVRDRAAD
mmetsp:Transcript_38605/g.99139  ORF Transcript_38605/g.99139 Transcript_38605/m.99139 type:complete len:211 (-) Transcript_38605:402-1034(-)